MLGELAAVREARREVERREAGLVRRARNEGIVWEQIAASPDVAYHRLPSPRGGVVKVRVDPEKCQGHNRCYSLAPELFVVDDYGYATAAGDGVVPSELEGKAKLAAANCPEYAVIIEDEG